MNVVQIIEKKISNKELTKDELSFFFDGYANNTIKDYQVSAFLMAIVFNGMTDSELFIYTQLLIDSGITVEFDDLDKRVDKHSTGGIGDKISLILSPVLAANGLTIGKISGRGLGFTGGTVDKLESIPGFRVSLTLEEFMKYSKEDGISLIGTSKDFAPLDKSLYALRDVTGTVGSKHLIAASIMSKKLLINTKYIYIDLKCGKGAFIKNVEQAKEITVLFKKIAKAFDREVFIIISNMDEPLGTFVGNHLEVYEAIEILKGNLKNDAFDLMLKTSSTLVSKIKGISSSEASEQIIESINNNSVFESFSKWIKNQGGDLDKFMDSGKKITKYEYIIKSSTDGYLFFEDVLKIGYGLIELGGGRKIKEDKINFGVGFEFLFKNNDYVSKYEEVIIVYSDDILSEEFLEKIRSSFSINKNKKEFNLILEEISW